MHEIIPVALNAAYDVKRLNRVCSRRTFTEVLSLGEIDGADDCAEFEGAVTSLYAAAEVATNINTRTSTIPKPVISRRTRDNRIKQYRCTRSGSDCFTLPMAG